MNHVSKYHRKAFLFLSAGVYKYTTVFFPFSVENTRYFVTTMADIKILLVGDINTGKDSYIRVLIDKSYVTHRDKKRLKRTSKTVNKTCEFYGLYSSIASFLAEN